MIRNWKPGTNEAMLSFRHRAAVYMKDYNGYFDLREVTAVTRLWK